MLNLKLQTSQIVSDTGCRDNNLSQSLHAMSTLSMIRHRHVIITSLSWENPNKVYTCKDMYWCGCWDISCRPMSQKVHELLIQMPDLLIILCTVTLFVMIKSSQNFAHVTTAQLSWLVQNSYLIRSKFLAWAKRIFFKIWIISLWTVDWNEFLSDPMAFICIMTIKSHDSPVNISVTQQRNSWPGACPTNDISIKLKIRPKFAVLWFIIYSTNYNEILHTPRQVYFCNMCKISLRSL